MMHMCEVGAFEEKNRLGALLDEVERGEQIVITRRGRPVAKLVPAGRISIGQRLDVPSPACSRQAAASLSAV